MPEMTEKEALDKLKSESAAVNKPSDINSLNPIKNNNPSDMSAGSAGSQRNTNQPDASDLDNSKAPAPGTGDTGAGLATDGRGKQKLDSEVKDHTSGPVTNDVNKGGPTSGTTAGVTGIAADKGAGYSADVLKKMNEPVRVKRLLGTEEIEVLATRSSMNIIDRNGRKLTVGLTVHLPVRIVGMNSAQEIEVVYPPYLPVTEEVPYYKDGKLVNADGSNYDGSTFKLNDSNKVINIHTNAAPETDSNVPKQQTLIVDAVKLERF